MAEHLHDPHFWVLIAFLVFVGLVIIYARKTITNAIDARRNKIAADIQRARDLLRQAEILQGDAQKTMENAQNQAKDILAKAKDSAKILVKEAGERAELHANKKMQALENRIAQEEQRITAEAKQALADLAVHIARENLRTQLQNKTGQAIFDQSLQSISTQKIGA